MDKKEFKPVLLYRKEDKVKELLKAYESKREILNIALGESQSILDRKLSNDEIIKLIATPGLFLSDLKNEIRLKFPFEKGTDGANLDLLGINYKEIDSTFARLSDSRAKYRIIEGEILPDKKQIEALEKSCDVYSTCREQNEIFEAATNLANTINEFAKLMQGTHVHFCRNISSGLLQPEFVDGKINAVVQPQEIKYI